MRENLLSKISLKEYAESQGINFIPSTNTNEYIALCPFHSEKTPSFTLNDCKGVFYCHACGVRGNTLDFIRQFNDLNTDDAFALIRKILGIPDNSHSRGDLTSPAMYEHACQFYEQKLARASRIKTEYLKPRGINDDSIKLFRIGAIGEARELYQYLIRTGYTKDAIYYSGLLKITRRMVFPIIIDNQVAGFSGRRILDTDNTCKYINSPFFSKKTAIFLPPSFQQTNVLYVVEGFTDVVLLHQNGYLGASIMGASCSREQLELLEGLNKDIVFCLDGDIAGLSALMAIADLVIRNSQFTQLAKAKFMLLPTKTDPDSLIRSNNGRDWEKAINNALSFPEFLAIGGKKLMLLKKLEAAVKSKNYILIKEIKDFFYKTKGKGDE